MKKVTVDIHNPYKDGRKKPWRVRWTPPGQEKSKSVFFKTKKKAEAKKKDLEILYNHHPDIAKHLSEDELVDCISMLRLTSNEDAKGKSLKFAVGWFVENYQDLGSQRTIAEYYSVYREMKKNAKGSMKVSEPTLREDDQYLRKGKEALCKEFGARKPSEITTAEIQAHIDGNTSQYHRAKALRTFFNWLAGEGKWHNETPCLVRNPMKGVQSEGMNTVLKKTVATNQEVCDLLKLANTKEYGFSGAFWAFLFYTGLRPTEAERFWVSGNKFGWKQIQLEDAQPYLHVPGEVIGKPGLPSRRVEIRPGFLQMLKEFKKGGEAEYPLKTLTNWKRNRQAIKHKIWGKRLTISSKMDEAKDITRHTFITNLYICEGMKVATRESGDSEKTLRQHYINTEVSEADADFYFNKINQDVFYWGISVP